MKFYEKMEHIIENDIFEFVREIRDEDSIPVNVKLEIGRQISYATEQLNRVVKILKEIDK